MTALQQFEKTVLSEICPAGEAWMCEVKKGQYFRIIDLEGNQAVDTLFISAENPEERYSATGTLDKYPMHSCRNNFMYALAKHPVAKKHGLNVRHIGPNINFFMNVPVTADGHLKFDDGISAPGKYVEIKAEMDLIVLISNCPQLNNPCNAYNPTQIQLVVREGEEA